MADLQQKTIETYCRLMDANAMVQTFQVARRIGIFAELAKGQKTSPVIAQSLQLAERPLELLLDQLCETGYIEKYGDDYALSVLGKMLPVKWSDLGNRYWENFEDWLRNGERIPAADEPIHQTEYGLEAQAFEWMSTPNALELIQILNVGQSRKGMHLMELACGSAVFSSALGYHDSEMKISLVDSAGNLERARATAESVEITDRCQFVDADPKVVDSRFDADIVLLANRLSEFDNSELKGLLTNAKKLLGKKGEIVVVDEFCETGDKRFSHLKNGLLTEMRTPRGIYRSKKDVTDLLYECGYVEAMYSDLKSPPGTKGVLVAGVSPA